MEDSSTRVDCTPPSSSPVPVRALVCRHFLAHQYVELSPCCWPDGLLGGSVTSSRCHIWGMCAEQLPVSDCTY